MPNFSPIQQCPKDRISYWSTCRRDEVSAKEINHELDIYRYSAPKNHG